MHKPFKTEITHGGTQDLYRFDNGYGASVIRHSFSYGGDRGLFELAVIKFYKNGEWHLTYETPITDDVIGYLSDQDVQELLDRIQQLES